MANREWNPKSFFRHLTPDALKILQEWADVDLTLDSEGPLATAAASPRHSTKRSRTPWVPTEHSWPASC